MGKILFIIDNIYSDIINTNADLNFSMKNALKTRDFDR